MSWSYSWYWMSGLLFDGKTWLRGFDNGAAVSWMFELTDLSTFGCV
jgi:hypothetical protein